MLIRKYWLIIHRIRLWGKREYEMLYIFHFHFLKMEYIFTFSGKDWAGEKRKTNCPKIYLIFLPFCLDSSKLCRIKLQCQMSKKEIMITKLRNISNNSFGRKHKKCGHIVMELLTSFLFYECIKNKQARENLKLVHEGWEKKWMVKDM